MRIFINDQEIDFKLEQEKTLLDVIRSLEQWLHNQKLVIVSFEIDKKEYNQKDIEDNGQTPIEQFKEMKISASDFLQIEIDGIASLKHFFRELKEALAALNGNKLTDLLVRFPAAHATLPFFLSLQETAEGEQKRARLEKLFTGATFGMIKMWDEATKADALSICDYFFEALEKKSASFSTIGETSTKITKEMLAKLRDIVARLSEVSILLQTGKDSEAMQAIVAFSDMTLLFLRLITDLLHPQNAKDFSIEGESFENYSRALNILLRDLIEAFEKKDFILIGDLCEYEIAPKILKLIDHVEWVLPA